MLILSLVGASFASDTDTGFDLQHKSFEHDARHLLSSAPQVEAQNLTQHSLEIDPTKGLERAGVNDPASIDKDSLSAIAEQYAASIGALDIAKTSFEASDKYKNYIEEGMIKKSLESLSSDIQELLKTLGVDCKTQEASTDLNLKTQTQNIIRPVKEPTEIEALCEAPSPKTFECERVLSLRCSNKNSDCDSGGIVLASISSDMQFTYTYPTLTIGTVANDYWGSGVYERATTFNIKNLNDIKEFTLATVGFDDHLWIKVNGHTVYVGPHGGTQLIGEGWGHVHNGLGWLPCELGRNWQFNPNIDLRPYLKEGPNEIWTKTIVCGVGEGWMRITARQQCCNHWQEIWDKTCEEELARS